MQAGAWQVCGDSLIPVALGLALLAFGIAGLRTMAVRSVSLHMLRDIRDGIDPRASFEAGVARRVADLDRHGLARLRDDRLEITGLGRCVAGTYRVLCRLMGVIP